MVSYIDPYNTIGFSAYIEEKPKVDALYQGRETYYRIILISGVGEINYADSIFKFNGSFLIMSKPGTKCTWRFSKADSQAFVCIFKDEFLKNGCFNWTEQCDLLFLSTPIFELTREQESFVRALFWRIINEHNTSYAFKDDLIQNQICILMHTVFRLMPTKLISSPFAISASRAVFLELIELQFLAAGQVLHLN